MSFGVPSISKIKSIWWSSDRPGNRGRCASNSPRMQPADLLKNVKNLLIKRKCTVTTRVSVLNNFLHVYWLISHIQYFNSSCPQQLLIYSNICLAKISYNNSSFFLCLLFPSEAKVTILQIVHVHCASICTHTLRHKVNSEYFNVLIKTTIGLCIDCWTLNTTECKRGNNKYVLQILETEHI